MLTIQSSGLSSSSIHCPSTRAAWSSSVGFLLTYCWAKTATTSLSNPDARPVCSAGLKEKKWTKQENVSQQVTNSWECWLQQLLHSIARHLHSVADKGKEVRRKWSECYSRKLNLEQQRQWANVSLATDQSMYRAELSSTLNQQSSDCNQHDSDTWSCYTVTSVCVLRTSISITRVIVRLLTMIQCKKLRG